MKRIAKLTVNGRKIKCLRTERRGDWAHYVEIKGDKVVAEFRIHRSEFYKSIGTGYRAEILK